MMKKIAFIPVFLFFGILLMAVDCKKVLPDNVNFTYNIPEQHTMVKIQPTPGMLDSTSSDIQINFDSAVNANSQGIYKPEFASLSSALITTDSAHNFDAFKSLEVYITNATLGETLIASLNDVPEGTMTVNLATTNANVLPYLSTNTFKYHIRIATDKPILDPIPLTGNFGFNIKLQKAQ
jgi:hypothetical protein